MPRKEESDLVVQLKEAIRASGRSMRDISRQSGVHASQLSYFLSGQRDLTLETAGKIFDALGLEVVKKKPRKKTKQDSP